MEVGLYQGHIVLDGETAPLNSTQLNSTSCNGLRCEHLFVRISMTLIYIFTFQILRSLIYHQFQFQSLLQKGTEPHQFLAHVYCGQTAGWIERPLGTEVDIGPGHFVLDGFPAIGERGTAAPSFRPMPIVATVAHLCYC